MRRYVSLVVILGILAMLGGMFYQLLAPFLLPMFLAAMTAIVAEPLRAWMLRRCGDRRTLAAGLTTGLLVSGVLLPALVTTSLAATQLVGFTQEFLSLDLADQRAHRRELIQPALDLVATWFPQTSPEQLQQEINKGIRAAADRIAGNTLALASSTMGAVVGFVVATMVYLTALFFFLADGTNLIRALRELVPVESEQQERMALEFTKVTRAVVTATLLAAIVQALLTALAMQVLGFGHFLVFLVITTVAALIPMVGAWLIWLPFVFVLAADGRYGAAVGLALFGWFGISLVDNIVRMYILNSDAQLHPLLALVSVLGALEVMGLWGIFIGPIVASCFTAALRIANQELRLILLEPRDVRAAPPA
ncbi:MAG: AI-2E family transporter [Planctomycetaceae bacterium]|nr:AI-2E family transporter [Planctomycetaceae bacterium]